MAKLRLPEKFIKAGKMFQENLNKKTENTGRTTQFNNQHKTDQKKTSKCSGCGR